MKYDPHKHHRRSLRIKGYDYAQAGAYFVTLCTWQRECLFGEIPKDEMRLNDWGLIAAEAWEWLAEQYIYVELDEWVIMPNHMHGIIVLMDDDRRGGSRPAPTPTPKTKPQGQKIGALKTK
jgi:putative transposase